MTDKKPSEGTTSADDNVNNNIHIDKNGNVTREDDRDRHDSSTEWNAEESRTGRNK
ncbi:hypothetical protein [Flavobacterium subsaxonicum]|uniref:hypothetical protein n=1 Tax=Flavobacterium subsaxonicum TaxID=426226 RepID=UPI0003FF8CE6|nr:hypothetical protein [Flavobacterium subsaxonicum]